MPASAEAACLQTFAELGDELADVTGDGLCRADRLGEGTAYLYEIGRADRLDKFGCNAQGLIQTSAQFGAEAKSERRARLRQKIADRSEAERAQCGDSGGRNAQRLKRQPLQDGRAVPLGRDGRRLR